MAHQLTPAQQAAVNERNKTLLVSAAAGSGKTTTLAARIIDSLTDEERPADISRMLIVTFTRAAAAGLRDKISEALTAEMARNSHAAARLSSQLLLLPSARISTIDSFCLDLVRENATRVGLSPAFRLADTAESALLAHNVMARLIDDGYAGRLPEIGTAEEFADLADRLCAGRADDELGAHLLGLYDRAQGYVRAEKIFGDLASSMLEESGKDPLSTHAGAVLRRRAAHRVCLLIRDYDNLIAQIAETPDAAEYFGEVCAVERAALADLLAILPDGDYNGVTAALEAARNTGVQAKQMSKGKKTPELERVQSKRYALRDKLRSIGNECFAYSAAEFTDILRTLAAVTEVIGRLLGVFASRLDDEKRRRVMLDFNDVEHTAYALLTDENGAPSPLAEEVRAGFDWVYIDEYQDVNELQDRLFAVISGERNRFMVGDSKQSIYAYRGARPDIFAAVRAAFPPLAQAGDAPGATVFLSSNFRSQPAILEFVNLIFGRLMEAAGAERVSYTDDDRLIPGRTADPAALPVIFRVFADAAGKTATDEGEESADAEEDEGEKADTEEDDEDLPSTAESRYVAGEICRLIREQTLKDPEAPGGIRPVRPGDIVILVRKKKLIPPFEAALRAAGLRTETAAGKGFFLNPEILLAISLLNVIDNPRKDVDLSGVLRSPLYGFSLDDLIRIRREGKADGEDETTLYEALVAYAARHPEDTKCAFFLAQLDRFREAAEGQPVDRLIWRVYRETGLLSLAGHEKVGSPALRRANLMMLYDYARRFEGTSFKGLYSFIAYINEALTKGQSIDETRVMSAAPDTVRLMTIHQSKGLEFPICFFVGTGASINFKDTQASVLMDPDVGCALRLGDAQGFARYGNPIYVAGAEAIKEKTIDEEARVLYVALTRPMEALYVTGTVSDADKALSGAERNARVFDAAALYGCKSLLDMLLCAGTADAHFDFRLIRSDEDTEKAGLGTPVCCEDDQPTTAGQASAIPLSDELRARFAYDYPYRYHSELPSKLSVSRLYPAVLDAADDATAEAAFLSQRDTPADLPEAESDLPRFLGGRRNTAAEAGIVTHQVMQFCDFRRLRDAGVQAELDRLLEHRFIDARDVPLIRVNELEIFRRSALLDALLEPGVELFRELRFNVRMPAAAFTQDKKRADALQGESLLVQGVMDNVARMPDGRLLLIDYKTDRMTAEERKDPALGKEKLRRRHAAQLSYYVAACREIFGRMPDRVVLYSLALGDTVELDPVMPF